VAASGYHNGAGLKSLLALLVSRLLLFAFFQATLAVVLHSWMDSVKYWMITASITNLASIILLARLYKKERGSYFFVFHFIKSTFKTDVAIFAGLFLISIPVALVPSLALSTWLWGNTTYYHQMLFQPLSIYLTVCLLVIFPVSMALAELPTYFGYIMQRLPKHFRSRLWVLLVPVIFLSIQHCTLPFVFDLKFIAFRGLMYLPFSLMLGIALYKRPSLFPFLVIQHGLLDALAVGMYLR
jgi:hypothetical protein